MSELVSAILFTPVKRVVEVEVVLRAVFRSDSLKTRQFWREDAKAPLLVTRLKGRLLILTASVEPVVSSSNLAITASLELATSGFVKPLVPNCRATRGPNV